jgi:hypothetical protein
MTGYRIDPMKPLSQLTVGEFGTLLQQYSVQLATRVCFGFDQLAEQLPPPAPSESEELTTTQFTYMQVDFEVTHQKKNPPTAAVLPEGGKSYHFFVFSGDLKLILPRPVGKFTLDAANSGPPAAAVLWMGGSGTIPPDPVTRTYAFPCAGVHDVEVRTPHGIYLRLHRFCYTPE